MNTLHKVLTVSAGDVACPQNAASTTAHNLFDLYARHADVARAVAFRVLYDRHEAEDVVHDVFLTLCRKPSCFDPSRGTDRAWLLTAVRHRSLDHLRRRMWLTPQDVTHLADRLADPEILDVATELDSAARNAVLWAQVGALPPAQADLIRRAYVNCHTHQRIAQDTGLPLGTVKSRIRLGLDKLRCAMQAATLSGVDD